MKSTTRIEPPKPNEPVRSRFRSAYTVALDTLANKTYDLGLQGIKSKADSCRKEHPKLSKWTEFGTRYCFGVGLAATERIISKATGPTISCAVVYSNPFVVSTIARYVKTKRACQAPEAKSEPGQENNTQQKKFTLLGKPSIATYSGTFTFVGLFSLPAYVFVIDRMAKFLSDDLVTPLAAALSLIAANITVIALDYGGFYYLWKNKVCDNLPKGTFKDAVRGFISECKPLKIFTSEADSKPATTASEYTGQLIGIIEKYYLSVQALRPVFAAGVVFLCNIRPSVFVDSLFATMAVCGFGFAVSLITTGLSTSVSNKIEQNNKHSEFSGGEERCH